MYDANDRRTLAASNVQFSSINIEIKDSTIRDNSLLSESAKEYTRCPMKSE